jgi:hypothetical protein
LESRALPEVSAPGPHPDPPSDLSTRPLPISINQHDWFRLHGEEHAPLHFGSSGLNRFDAPDGEFGVLYLGDSFHCCFVETYGRIDRAARMVVTRQELMKRRLSSVRFARPLRLVDLSGAGLARIGADNRLCTADYRVAQRWSRALWSHPDLPDGLLYRSRHDPSRLCAALFERAADVATGTSLGNLLDPANHVQLAEILNAYAIGYLE